MNLSDSVPPNGGIADQSSQFNQADKYPNSPYGLLGPLRAAAELHHIMRHNLRVLSSYNKFKKIKKMSGS